MKKKYSILYNIFIPQEKLRSIAPKISSDGAIILDFISRWQLWSRDKAKKVTIKGKEYIWLHYPTLMKALPILRIRSKARITRRIDELIKSGLLEREKLTDNTLFVRLTDKATSLYISEDLALKSTQASNKVAPDLDTQRVQHNTNITNTKEELSASADHPSPGLSNKKKDSRVKELIDFFFEACYNIQNFKPVITGAADGAIIKKRLQNYSVEDIKDQMDWFLKSEYSDKLGCTIKVSLSGWSFNKWLSERAQY